MDDKRLRELCVDAMEGDLDTNDDPFDALLGFARRIATAATEEMRERAAKVCAKRAVIQRKRVTLLCGADRADEAGFCAASIRALPIERKENEVPGEEPSPLTLCPKCKHSAGPPPLCNRGYLVRPGDSIVECEHYAHKGQDRCEHCGGKNIYSGPPDCPGCGAPNCCQDCCAETVRSGQEGCGMPTVSTGETEYQRGYRAGMEEAIGLAENRAAYFRKYEHFMGAWDSGKEPWEVAVHCCDYMRGILKAALPVRIGQEE